MTLSLRQASFASFDSAVLLDGDSERQSRSRCGTADSIQPPTKQSLPLRLSDRMNSPCLNLNLYKRRSSVRIGAPPTRRTFLTLHALLVFVCLVYVAEKLSSGPSIILLREGCATTESKAQVLSKQPSLVRIAFLEESSSRANRKAHNSLKPPMFNVSSDMGLILPEEPAEEQQLPEWPQHEFDPNCKPMADWQNKFHPVCNEFHSFDFDESLMDTSLHLLSSKGYWRHVWQRTDRNDNATRAVWKTIKIEHPIKTSHFERNRIDAVAMEKLTSSRSVIDIYAFCGMSVVTEFAKLSVRHAAKKMNSVEKLDVAVQVARGLAAVHSIDNSKRASLVHNDITSANVVVTLDNRAVLNDFNTAILQTVHNETGEVCPFYSHYPNPQWRSPEEQVGLQKSMPIVTEKVDLYGLGNVLFVLAVGIKPWMKSAKAKISPEERDLISHVKLFNGTIPGVPMRIQRSRDPAIQALLKAMYKCYRFDPNERPSARNIADLLESEAMVVFPHFNYTPVLGLTGI